MSTARMSFRSWLVVSAASLAMSACGSDGVSGPMEVWDLQPRAGATAGEQRVIITGRNFRQDINYAVYFGALRATAVTIMDNQTLLVVTPQHEAGAVDMHVVADDGPAFRISNAYTFNDQGGNVMEQVGGPRQGPERF